MIRVGEARRRGGIIGWFRRSSRETIIARADSEQGSIVVWGDRIAFYRQKDCIGITARDVKKLAKSILGNFHKEFSILDGSERIMVIAGTDKSSAATTITVSVDGVQLLATGSVGFDSIYEYVWALAECIINCSLTNFPGLFPDP